MRLLWLVDVLRAAGLTVREYDGWRTRGSETWGPLTGVICHATAGSRTSTDAGETRTLWVTGSTSAPVPISQLYLSRSGEWTVGASGRCNHVAFRDVRPSSPLAGSGNSQLIGVEAQNDNRGEPWSARMLDSYQIGAAAICARMGWEAWRVLGHAEHQAGKSDPLGVDMDAFRRRVAALLEGDDVSWSERLTLPAWVVELWGDKDGVATAGGLLTSGYGHARSVNDRSKTMLTEQRAGFAAVLAKLAGEDVAATVQGLLEAAAVRERAERQAEQAALAATLADGVLAGLREQLGEVADERLVAAAEAGVRSALRRGVGES
jgi:hypothetical protein